MDKKRSFGKGSLKVSENVIATISRVAALEVDGVAELAPAKSTIKNVFVKSKSGYIYVQPMGDVVEVSVGLSVKHGYRVSQVAEGVQQNIKESVQGMTGITVSRVNVFIAAVDFSES